MCVCIQVRVFKLNEQSSVGKIIQPSRLNSVWQTSVVSHLFSVSLSIAAQVRGSSRSIWAQDTGHLHLTSWELDGK